MQANLGQFEQPVGLDDKVGVVPNGALQRHLEAVRHHLHVLAPSEVVFVEQVIVHGQLLRYGQAMLETEWTASLEGGYFV